MKENLTSAENVDVKLTNIKKTVKEPLPVINPFLINYLIMKGEA